MSFQTENEIIIAHENVIPQTEEDVIKAKNYLKEQVNLQGDNVYDHLADIIHRLVQVKPPNSVECFETISRELKEAKFHPTFDRLQDVYEGPDRYQMFQRLDSLYKKTEKKEESGLESQIPEEDEDDGQLTIPDMTLTNHFFKQIGTGLEISESFHLQIAIKNLVQSEPITKIRFFGKIFGTCRNYYIVETELTEAALEKRIAESDEKQMIEEEERQSPLETDRQDELMESDPVITEDEAVLYEIVGEGGDVKEIEELPPPLPPLPISLWSPPPVVPRERPGQGVNKKVYYVSTAIGDKWECLPDVTPQQIVAARQITRSFTGFLDTELHTYPIFPGAEREYLRAQLARISAATSVSPIGYYTFGSGEEEDMDEEIGGGDFNVNQRYEGHLLKDLIDPQMTYWVHHAPHILNQGRTIWWNPMGDEEGGEDLLEGKATPETGPHLMTTLSEDAFVENSPPWTVRASSEITSESCIAGLKSNIWPGAYAFATTGKRYDMIYIGWARKHEPYNYSPPPVPSVMQEYPIGPEIMEISDPTVAEEEAWRIAHMPPPPPEIPGEGGEEIEEEEDEEQEEEEEDEEEE